MRQPIPFSLTGPLGHDAALGLVVLQSDETIEDEMRRLIPDSGVAIYHSRVESAPEVTSETLAQMAHDLPAAAGRLPRPIHFDVVGYGCTSGASVIGSDRVAALVHAGCHTRHVTDPLSALVAACDHLGVSKLAFLSPYVEEVSGTLRGALAARGVDSPVFGSFDEAEETRVARIDGPSVAAAARHLAGAGGVDAVFMSCTNLRSFGVIDEIEAATGLPVLSSNLVLGWHMFQLAGTRTTGPGRLFAA